MIQMCPVIGGLRFCKSWKQRAGAWRAEIGRWWMGRGSFAGEREVVVEGPKRARRRHKTQQRGWARRAPCPPSRSGDGFKLDRDRGSRRLGPKKTNMGRVAPYKSHELRPPGLVSEPLLASSVS